LEAPPEEEIPDPDLLLDEGEDLSYASMFAAAIDKQQSPPSKPPLRVEVPEVVAPSKPKHLGSIALGSLLAATTPTESPL